MIFTVSEVERYKLEKKRERNRIAATKCRMRKMERISQLDGQVNITILSQRFFEDLRHHQSICLFKLFTFGADAPFYSCLDTKKSIL